MLPEGRRVTPPRHGGGHHAAADLLEQTADFGRSGIGMDRGGPSHFAPPPHAEAPPRPPPMGGRTPERNRSGVQGGTPPRAAQQGSFGRQQQPPAYAYGEGGGGNTMPSINQQTPTGTLPIISNFPECQVRRSVAASAAVTMHSPLGPQSARRTPQQCASAMEKRIAHDSNNAQICIL